MQSQSLLHINRGSAPWLGDPACVAVTLCQVRQAGGLIPSFQQRRGCTNFLLLFDCLDIYMNIYLNVFNLLN